jgi:hypothetical protein
VREIRLLRSTWRGLETELRLGLHGHERGNPGHRQDINLTDHRASPRPYQILRVKKDQRCQLHSCKEVLNVSFDKQNYAK